MSRSGYSDSIDNWELIMWRGRVASAIRGKRGQALLKELKKALLALPEKKLCGSAFAKDGQVCALGAVDLRRKVAAGTDHETAVKLIEKEWPDQDQYSTEFIAGKASQDFDIAECLAQEIMYVNDEMWEVVTPEERYKLVLKWVREQIAPAKS